MGIMFHAPMGRFQLELILVFIVKRAELRDHFVGRKCDYESLVAVNGE